MKVYGFHQLVVCEKGPVNTAIVDFLQGNIFQVPTKSMEKFENKEYDDIGVLIKALKKEDLILEIEENRWIPRITFDGNTKVKMETSLAVLELESAIDAELAVRFFSATRPGKIYYYGQDSPGQIPADVPVIIKKKDFSRCKIASRVCEDFLKANREDYTFNMHFNSCWGFKVAISKNMEVKPCIYSEIVIGHLGKESISTLIKKLEYYWGLTKDKIDTCKDCELKYICFDCREIAFRKFGSLSAPNPNCKYNPHTGKWR